MSFKSNWNRFIKNLDQKLGEKKDAEKTGKKDKPMTLGRKILRGVISAVCCMIIFGCLCGCILSILVFTALGNDEQLLNLDMQKMKYSTIFYADDGVTELARAYDPNSGDRVWCDYEDMPDYLINALVAVEDKRFWEHNGVDLFTTGKAGISAIMQKFGLPGLYGGRTPGGSTITQQVVRNLTGDKATEGLAAYTRKLREIFRAVHLEKYYTKEQILENYLNLVGFSQNCSGIEAAANCFFNKTTGDLTVAEAATIIGTTKSPTALDPYIHWEENQKRKDDILYMMKQQKYMSDEEYEEAINQEIVLYYGESGNTAIQSWFIDYATEQVIKDLAEEYDVTEAEANSMLINNGYRIYTTCDADIQTTLEEVYSSLDNFPKVGNEEYPESAFIITDTSGAIKGMMGSNRPKTVNRAWNRATDTTRQPGSTIKPISSYVLGIDSDLITYSTVLEDRHVVINPDPVNYSEDFWAPKNEDLKYRGYITVQYALMRSINTIPVQLTMKMGARTLYNFLHDNLNMYTITEADIGYSPMALGSLSQGVTLLEMAGAYQMYGNGGYRTEPYAYTKVEDVYGNTILTKQALPVRVISDETYTVMNKLLQTVTSSSGTGAAAPFSSSIPVAGKTGTTDDSVDQWFVGVTPYYVGVCWLGYDDRYKTDDDGNVMKDENGKAIPNSILYAGLGYPPPKLWKTVMSQVHEGLGSAKFPVSSTVVSLDYCTETGMIAGPGCTSTKTGWYKSTNIPETCTYHNGGFSYGETPLVGSTSEELGITYGDEYLAYAYDIMTEYNNRLIPVYDRRGELVIDNPNKMTPKQAVAIVEAGYTSFNEFLSSPYFYEYADKISSTAPVSAVTE